MDGRKTWKTTSFWEGNFSGAMLNFRRLGYNPLILTSWDSGILAKVYKQLHQGNTTVDGSDIRRAPVDMWVITLFTRFYTSQGVVWDIFHQGNATLPKLNEWILTPENGDPLFFVLRWNRAWKPIIFWVNHVKLGNTVYILGHFKLRNPGRKPCLIAYRWSSMLVNMTHQYLHIF